MDKISELSKPLKKHKWPELDCRNTSLGPKENSLKRKKREWSMQRGRETEYLEERCQMKKIVSALFSHWIFKITDFVKYAKKNDKNKHDKRDLDKRQAKI